MKWRWCIENSPWSPSLRFASVKPSSASFYSDHNGRLWAKSQSFVKLFIRYLGIDTLHVIIERILIINIILMQECVCSVVSNSLWPDRLAHQASLFMEFFKQEYSRGLFPDPGIKHISLVSPVLARRSFTTAQPGKLEHKSIKQENE